MRTSSEIAFFLAALAPALLIVSFAARGIISPDLARVLGLVSIGAAVLVWPPLIAYLNESGQAFGFVAYILAITSMCSAVLSFGTLGTDPGDDGNNPEDTGPPSGGIEIDWERFERDLAEHSRRTVSR